MKTKSLIRHLATIYPQKLRDSYDFGGLMVGPYKEETKRILLCLDYDETIEDKAISFKPDLIITHHPFFFGNPKKILEESAEKRRSFEFLKREGIPLASYHTNFDRAKEGMNDALAEALCLSEILPLKGDDMARGGKLPFAMSMDDLSRYVIEKLGIPYVGLIKEGKEKVSRVALIGGGGWRSFPTAMEEGYDAFLSGDCPHHGRREIILSHYNYIDMPHEVETIFVDKFANTLLNINHELTIFKVRQEHPWEIVQRVSK